MISMDLSGVIPKNVELRQFIDTEIDSTKRTIQTLQTRLYDLYEAWNSTSIIHTILTSDILAEIFLFASQDYRIMPFVLGGVCRAWRKLAWQTPRLWNQLVVKFSPRHTDTQKLIEDWIARSRSLPLELQILCQDGHIPSLEHVRPLLTASSRWKTLHLGSGTFEHLRNECARLRCEFPLLSSVRLEERTTGESTPWNFLSSPISDLTITGNNGALNLVQWNNLQTFVGYRLDVAHCLSAFKAIASDTSRCQSCTLSLIGSGEINDTNDEPYVLSQLQHLHIKMDSSPASRIGLENIDFSRLFGSIETPALTSLEMTMCCVEVVFANHIVNTLKRSQTSLSVLVIDRPNITEDDLVVALRELPSLSILSYTSFYRLTLLTDETMFFLNPEPEGLHNLNHPPDCLPNLTQFKYSGPVEFDLQVMIDMLKSRIRHCEATSAPLKKLLSFKIGYCNKDWAQDQDPNEIRDFHQAITALRAQGPDIDISWGKRHEHRC